MDYAIGLGGNLGSRENHLQAGLELLLATDGCELVASSNLYESDPVGPPQPSYLNAAARIASELAPEALLARLLEIERTLGRERREPWGARTLDLDVLWAEVAVETPQLQVPHPRLMERWFALNPLLEVAPELARSTPALAMAGRLLHPFALDAGSERNAPGLFAAYALDRADALAAVLTAAARAAWPGLTCRDCSVELLRVQAGIEQQPEALIAALHDLVTRGFAVWRFVVSTCDEQSLSARVLGAAREGGSSALARARLTLTDDALGSRAELHLTRPM
jgi:2-amino-4-hydroxy-6-hydroxymethyldihydropteridine diphosphokinase